MACQAPGGKRHDLLHLRRGIVLGESPRVGWNNRFVGDGCDSMRVESAKSHATSHNHQLAEQVVARLHAPTKAPIVKTVRKMNIADEERITRLFRNAHALAKNNRPYSDFKWMNDLDRAKGLDVQDRYDNSKYGKLFTSYIAKTEMDALIEECTTAKFVCLLSDGSTDLGTAEQEMVFVRYVTEGDIKVKFLGVRSVEKANATGICDAIKISVSKYFEWPEFAQKLVAFGCDGAAVMVGRKNGVSTLLQQDQPSLVVVHCFAHKLELALKDAVKKNKLYEKTVNGLLMGIYYFYHKSPLNRSMLKRSQQMLCLKSKPLPTRVGGTRWIPHTVRAINNFITSMDAIKQHLEQVCKN